MIRDVGGSGLVVSDTSATPAPTLFAPTAYVGDDAPIKASLALELLRGASTRAAMFVGPKAY
jgi:hypothetical protein